MHKRLNKILLAIAIYITPLTYSSVQAKIARPIDTVRLEQASNFVNSKHYKQGYVSFKHMAKHGCRYSQCILGIMRQNGIGSKKNSIQAKYWFQKSARQGFADAQQRLGLMYLHGDGVKKNLTLARQWLTKAANQDVAEAKELLAQIPRENAVSSQLAQAPQQVVGTATNIQKSWQGYAQVSQQLSQLLSAAQSQ